MFIEILKSFIGIALELTVLFIGISFLIQLLQGFIPYHRLEKVMEKSPPLLSALAALVFAFVTPFCSCSTIPVITHLLQQKVRFGIVMIFLFASPVLDPTILGLMSYLLGWKVTIIYTLLTAIFSMIIGFLLEKLGFESQVKRVLTHGKKPAMKRVGWKGAWQETVQLMKTVYPYLLIGAAIGALIQGAVPSEWMLNTFGGENWWLVPIAAIVGIPLYIRLSTMIPISQVMIVKGMALGPVMALMISSAGASLPEITLLSSIFKRKLVIAFILSVISMSTLSGLLFLVI